MKRICYKELIELFIIVTIPELINKNEGYRINFIFNDQAFTYFNDVKDNPFELEDCWTPSISDTAILKLRDIDPESPSIVVHDHELFFSLLQDIVNASLETYEIYHEHRSARNLAMNLMRRIWLRMGPEDFNNVIEFLERQLAFYQNGIFDEYQEGEYYTQFGDFDVLVKSNVSATWDESPRNINFKIVNEKEVYDLPKIHYGINEDTCYIYGIQGLTEGEKSKKIARSIYKLNKGNDTDIHPSFILSMMLFTDLLRNQNITKIRVPILQVLSYDYHIDLSKRVKEEFTRKWTQDAFERLAYLGEFTRNAKLRQYEHDLKWYNNVVDKYDLISEIKTEKLITLMQIVQDRIEDFHIRNDIDIQGTYLDISIKNDIKKKI